MCENTHGASIKNLVVIICHENNIFPIRRTETCPALNVIHLESLFNSLPRFSHNNNHFNGNMLFFLFFHTERMLLFMLKGE